MDADEDDGSDGVCDVLHDVWLCCVVMLCDDVVCDGVWDVVCDGVSGVKGSGNVKWMILICLGVLVTDRQMDRGMDIGGSRVASATENVAFVRFWVFIRKSNSRIINVHLSVCPLVCQKAKPHSISELLLLTIEPTDNRAYQPLSLLTIGPIDHRAYRHLVFFCDF